VGIGTLLIRADASPEIGTGHVMRCLALAQEWQDRGGKVIFAVAQCTAAVRARLTQENCEVVSCAAVPGSADDALITSDIARRSTSQWLVLDGYAFGRQYQTRIHEDGIKVLFVDDLAGCDSYEADIVLNKNLSASEGQYRGLTTAQLLLGTRHCLLRREFRAWAGWNRNTETAEKILITLGGSTPEGLAQCIFEALERIKSKITSAVFLLGGSSTESELLNRAAAGSAGVVTIRRAAADVATLMAGADIAIAAAGSTCLELCFMGLPSLLVDVAANQTPEALELQRQDCARYLGSSSTVSVGTIVDQLTDLLSSDKTRQAISMRCRKLVDGCGAERVVSALLGERAGIAHSLTQQGACP